jgi:hypothetical protein
MDDTELFRNCHANGYAWLIFPPSGVLDIAASSSPSLWFTGTLAEYAFINHDYVNVEPYG